MPAERRREWILKDLELIKNRNEWPGSALHMKSHPWNKNKRFGLLFYFQNEEGEPHHPTYQVILKDLTTNKLTREVESFETPEELVEVWAVD